MVGSHVARMLAQRGDELALTVRPQSRLDNIDFEHALVACDILDRRAVRRAMRGVTRVFHTAGTTSLRARPDLLHRVNVEGTRIVLEEALRAGCRARRLHVVDRRDRSGAARDDGRRDADVPGGRQRIPYVASKRAAEEQAMRLIGLGLPAVIVNPAHVFGVGDTTAPRRRSCAASCAARSPCTSTAR